jgi:hypothetical protein
MVASIPTFCSAIAATGPPMPHPMTSAVLRGFCILVVRRVSRERTGLVFRHHAAFCRIVR